MTPSGERTILLVEDDPGHARLIEKNLRRAGAANPIVVLRDGQEAIDFLFQASGEGASAELAATRVLLILLDLNLPVLDGCQVLRRLKAHPQTRRIPVFILTTSDDPQGASACYEMGCNVYIIKPVDYLQFIGTIRRIGEFLSIMTPSEP